jgi:uncharacterized membrane protein YgcG
MFTGISSQVGALVTAIVVLTGGSILRGGAAAADPNQDDQFLALLEKQDIPAIRNVPSLIDTAHTVCRKLDGGMPADDLVDLMVNNAYSIDSTARQYAPGRLARTEARFITAAVGAYCPGNESKIGSLKHHLAAYTRDGVNSGSDLRKPPRALDVITMPAAGQEPTGSGVMGLPHVMNGGVLVGGRYGDDRPDGEARGAMLASLIGAVPSGDMIQPDPPQLPPPSPPAGHLQIAPRPIAAPPRPQQPPPPPQQPPPPPEQPPPPPQQPPPPPEQPPPPPLQPPPPAVAPQPGGAAGSGGGGNGGGGNGGGGNGGGGGGPAGPKPFMPPGFVRVAP